MCNGVRRGVLGVFAPVLLTFGCLKTPDRYAQSTLDVNVNPPANFELEGEPFWQALKDGRKPSSPVSAPALAADYAALAHEILTRINAMEAAAEPDEVMA